MSISRRNLLLAALAAVVTPTAALGNESKLIALYVKDMHCQSCAKKIAAKLYAIPGVVKVTTDVPKGVAIIVPEKNKQPSPKAMWEAVEQANFEPVKLASPLGTFTSRPLR